MIYIDYNGENQDLYIPRASISPATGSTDNDKIVFLTQEEYDALDPKEDKLYVVTDTPAVYVGETFIGPCCSPTPTPSAEDISIVIPSSIVGEGDAEVVVVPGDADVDLEFTSSDPSIATIDENGHITVLADGEVTFCIRDSKSGLQDCQTVAVEVPYFMFSPLSISAPSTGGTYNISIVSNYPQEWTITSPGWTTLSTSSGTGSGTITLTITGNDGDERNGSIVLSGSGEVLGNILVSQDEYKPFVPFVVDPSYLNVPASGGVYTIRVTSLYPWSASLDGSEWLTLSPTSGTGTGRWEDMTAIISPAGQSEYPERSSIIVVTNTNGEERFCDISQEYEEPSREIYVQTLIDEGYANVVTGAGGTYIEILPTTPYSASQVLDLGEVARNEKQLTGTTNNIIVWNQELPNGWTNSDITSLYTNKQLNFSPRGEMLWALGDVDNFEITFSGGGWIAVDYPWGSYQSEGVFAPRWNQNKQAEYISKGFLKTPKNLTVNLTGSFSSVSQVMFTQIKSTTALTINQQEGTFACHDVTGMFEGDNALVTLNITGAFNYGTWRTQHNVFDGCTALTGIPYSTSWTREHSNNTVYPHADGVRGSANCRHMFRGCTSLTYLGPTFNMGAISLSGCTYDGQTQAALTDTLFDCPALTDVRIINMNNNDWNFSDSSTFTYIPAMSVASIEYLLNNAADVNSQGGHTVTFNSLHKNEVSQSAIDAAAAKGWNVVWDGDSPTPDTGYSAQYLTIEALESGNLKATKSNTNLHFYYSVNDGEWVESLETGSSNYVIISVNEGDRIRFKANHTSCWHMFENNTISCNAYGNVSSMIYGDDFSGNTIPVSCTRMFENNTGIVDASNLVLPGVALSQSEFISPGIYAYMFKGCTSLVAAPELPATTLGPNCYYEMFVGCTNLEDAPALPATELAADCYYGMFSGCTSLATAPELPATTLASDCYEEMFRGCTSLTTAPALPATILASKCYMNMFAGCTSLATAPELSATTLVTYCYNGMFYGCSSLNYVKCLATDISAEYCTYAWLNRTASTGTFVKAASMNWTRDDSGVPSGWTIQNA